MSRVHRPFTRKGLGGRAKEIFPVRPLVLFFLPVSAILVSGCISTVADVVTAPVKIVSKGVDLATTSQSEADEKRGREIRRREEQLAKLEREYEKELDKCHDGNERACNEARETYAQMQQIIPTIPVEPGDD